MTESVKIVLPTSSAVALWNSEITGQLSDGMWENTAPYDHWKVWNHMEAVIGPVPMVTPYTHAKKTGYNLAGLIEYVGDRMLASGRMAKANPTLKDFKGGEYMPLTIEEFKKSKETGDWNHHFVGEYMAMVTVEMAEKFYATEYTMKELKADLRSIKKAMKTAK